MSQLYIVPTPIGNVDDMVPRAVTVLQHVDIIAAEDTRHSRHLLNKFSIDTKLLAYHEHNEQVQADYLLAQMQSGLSVALISDAGTPLISDPGYRLVSAAVEHGITITPIPGPVAAMVALSASGLASDRFTFEGFLPAKQGKRLAQLHAFKGETRTLIFYESPHRVLSVLGDMLEVFGEKRRVCVARELTKKFETIKTACLTELLEWMEADSNQQRGEFVLLVEGAEKAVEQPQVDAWVLAQRLAQELPPNRAAAITAELCGLNKRDVYQQLLDK